MNSVPSPFHAVRREKLSEQIGRQLLTAVVTQHYRDGDRLPSERALMTSFKASRSAVREALGQLAAKGIVTVEQGRSTVVNPPHEWNSLDLEILLLFDSEATFDQLTEVRRIIEPEIAALAAERITPEGLEILRDLATSPPYETMEQHVERDTRFHLELAKAAKNTVLLIVMASINDLLRESRRRAYVVPGELEKAWQYHQEVYTAIERRDADAAGRLMAEHIGQVAGALARYKVMEQQAAREPADS